ncbi:hypothetical protein BBAD15_g5144 [Beauveria bassiana D1-5]|uniref:Uncharacterized protein n=1 Tax=Beauveria bassiana D1-5 TaxID=1245745 RepID=A0A0A2VT31_BEABA|nr:hypothetical protein BBAD15_g5144 [Beauveria bassiana D1-5]
MDNKTGKPVQGIRNSQPTLTFHQGLLNSSAPHHVVNITQMHNATNGTLDNLMNPLVATTGSAKNPCDICIAGVILGLIFAFFFAIVAIDMRAKYRTGELRDDMRGIKNVLVLVLKAVPMLLVALFSKIRSLVSRKQAVPAEADGEAAAQKTRESQVIVQRLVAKSESEGANSSVASADIAPVSVAPASVAPASVAPVSRAPVSRAPVSVGRSHVSTVHDDSFGVGSFGGGSFGGYNHSSSSSSSSNGS